MDPADGTPGRSPWIGSILTGRHAGEAGGVLCINCGSSSLKFSVHGASQASPARRLDGAVEGIGADRSRVWLKDAGDVAVEDGSTRVSDHDAAIHAMLAALDHHGLPAPIAAGHRVLHGGPDRHGPARIDDALLTELRDRVPLAPLHLPAELAAIASLAARFPGLVQVACFDTAFHRTMPGVAQALPLPRAIRDAGVVRYGFHGLSCESVVASLGDGLAPRAVIAHLGSGASLTAILHGRSVETTMGFTPTGGIVMGTRSGDLDPGILLYLLRRPGWDVARLERLVTREAGLLGLSGSSADMRTLLARRDVDRAAASAVEIFCYRVRKEIGALATVLGGIDQLVFTGGIGEAACELRREICAGLEYLDIRLDPHADGPRLSATDSRCDVRVVPADENRVIARQVRRLLRLDPAADAR